MDFGERRINIDEEVPVTCGGVSEGKVEIKDDFNQFIDVEEVHDRGEVIIENEKSIGTSVSDKINSNSSVKGVDAKHSPACEEMSPDPPKISDYEIPLARYSERLPQRTKDPLYTSVLREVGEQFRIPKVRPYHIDDSIRHFQHPEQSPGLPYINMGFKRMDEIDRLHIKQYVRNLKYDIYNRCNTPCRTTVARTPELRLIWGYPAHMTFAEGMFVQPLIRGYRRAQGIYGLWIQNAEDYMRLLQSHRQSEESSWLGLYWNSFDPHVPAWLIRDAFQIILSNMDLTGYEEYGAPVHPHTLPNLQRKIVNYFINTPIKLLSGKVFRKKQGVPSGSSFTNLVDSVVNAIVTQFCLQKMSVVYSRMAQWYMGDNGLILLHDKINLAEFAKIAHEVFGFHLNLDKTETGEYIPAIPWLSHVTQP
ncbi:uncharacterized protein LOC123308761 isoform X4 [Coccinella septempunctata]|uniref:uncharacterized protein LOC123308761 isoform X4 n=1 Tax=Coccinella septempunctata TaxID=41139 RepID=UPI001D06C9B0|nr:uncharacterized protein LOC123308761 isoform X4 [Coccinella septempunctata]